MRQPPVNLAPRQRFPTKQISTKSRTTSTVHEVHDVIDVDAAELERPEAVKSITAEVKLESTPEPDFVTEAKIAAAKSNAALQAALVRAAAESSASVVPEPVTSAALVRAAAESSAFVVPEPVTSAVPEPRFVSSATTGGVVDLSLDDSDDE